MNPNTWKKNKNAYYHEWVAEAGMWELTDPKVATHRKGSALDKFLLLPGTNIPDAWLPSGNMDLQGISEDGSALKGCDQQREELFYPAYAYGFPVIADHFPVMLAIPGLVEQADAATRVLRLGDLSPEEWGKRDDRLNKYFSENASQIKLHEDGGNPHGYWTLSVKG